MSPVFLVLILILVIIIALIVFAATSNRPAYYPGPTPMYGDPDVVIIDDTPIIAGMIAADIATDIAFSAGQGDMMGQGQYFDSQDSGFGGNDFMGGDSGFDSSSSGFDSGGDF